MQDDFANRVGDSTAVRLDNTGRLMLADSGSLGVGFVIVFQGLG